MENVILNNNPECPVIGIGTFMLAPADAKNSVREALKIRCPVFETWNSISEEVL